MQSEVSFRRRKLQHVQPDQTECEFYENFSNFRLPAIEADKKRVQFFDGVCVRGRDFCHLFRLLQHIFVFFDVTSSCTYAVRWQLAAGGTVFHSFRQEIIGEVPEGSWRGRSKHRKRSGYAERFDDTKREAKPSPGRHLDSIPGFVFV